MPHTERKVWWVCPKQHEFESKVAIIAAARLGCPICRGYRVQVGVNDLATLRPDIAAQWHPTKNPSLVPQAVTIGSGRPAWWICADGHEWKTAIAKREDRGCPYCKNVYVVATINSLRARNPELAAQLHPTKNGDCTAEALGSGTAMKV